MSETLASWLVTLLTVYAAVGLVFAVAFVTKGVGKIDEGAEDGTRGFRVLIFPGAVALWPLLLGRWRRGGGEPPAENNPHRRRALEGGDA